MSDINGLNDNCFVLASNGLIELAEAMEGELGRKPTLEELCEVLAWGFQGAGANLLSDVDPARVSRVTCKLRSAKVAKLTPGDIVAVPSSEEGKWHLGVYITDNRFGRAFGFFKGLWPCRPPKGVQTLEPIGIPIHTTLHSIWDGTWRLLGNSPELLSRFTTEPEIYHSKEHHLNNDRIGRFGSAENARDGLRSIDKDEAERVGLLDGSYRQGELSRLIGKYLDELENQLKRYQND